LAPTPTALFAATNKLSPTPLDATFPYLTHITSMAVDASQKSVSPIKTTYSHSSHPTSVMPEALVHTQEYK
jgi:hypothetical protein